VKKGRRVVIAGVAIAFALVAGVGANFYVSEADKRAQKNEDLVEAFVAGSDIPKGTTGQQAVGSGLIVKEQVRRANRPETALPDTSSIATQVASTDIPKGQYILTGGFVDQSKAAPGLADLSSGMQAISIAIDDVRGVAGFVQPGDRVNILHYSKLRTPPNAAADANTAQAQTSFLAQNIRVMAVGHQAVNSVPSTTAPGAAAPAATSSGLLTLEVNATDAEKIVMASQGTIYLSLVPKGFKPEIVAPVVDVVNLGFARVPPTDLIG